MIEQCAFCHVDTAGRHEFDCPTGKGKPLPEPVVYTKEDVDFWRNRYETCDNLFWQQLQKLTDILEVPYQTTSFVKALELVQQLVYTVKELRAKVAELENKIQDNIQTGLEKDVSD